MFIFLCRWLAALLVIVGAVSIALVLLTIHSVVGVVPGLPVVSVPRDLLFDVCCLYVVRLVW